MEILQAALITIPLWGSLLFAVAAELPPPSDWSDRSDCAAKVPDMKIYRENWRQRREHRP